MKNENEKFWEEKNCKIYNIENVVCILYVGLWKIIIFLLWAKL